MSKVAIPAAPVNKMVILVAPRELLWGVPEAAVGIPAGVMTELKGLGRSWWCNNCCMLWGSHGRDTSVAGIPLGDMGGRHRQRTFGCWSSSSGCWNDREAGSCRQLSNGCCSPNHCNEEDPVNLMTSNYATWELL